MPEDRPPDEGEPIPGAEEPAAADKKTTLAEAVEPVPEGEASVAYHQRARLAEDRLAEVLAAYRTLKKDTEQHRDRLSRNLERRFDQRRERLLQKFIDILDNLDRALEAAQSSWAGQPLLEGMILVRTQLLGTLKAEGLERIPVLGLPFDPGVSESVGTEPVEDAEQHQVVVKELMRGYRLQGRVARVSRVVIGVFGEEANAVAPPVNEELVGVPLEAEVAGGELADDANDRLELSAEDSDAPDAGNLEALMAEGDEPAEKAEGGQGPELQELSLEEIIRRAEAQEALFPTAFSSDDDPEGTGEPEEPGEPEKS